uniref:SAGA-associated factor 29 n=1 Tax=Knipowitschia caucasica TaxID=637954 RepID=A0AAV2KIM3_KNICA
MKQKADRLKAQTPQKEMSADPKIVELLSELHQLIKQTQEERSRSEHNLLNIQKTHERMQTENKTSPYYRTKLRGLYTTAKADAEAECSILRHALDKIAEVKSLMEERRIAAKMAGVYSDSDPPRKTMRRGVLMTLLQQSAMTLPLWIGKPGESPPPLCGATPASSDYVAKQGDKVAARVKVVDGDEQWILAEVVSYSHSANKYEVDDIDEEGKDLSLTLSPPLSPSLSLILSHSLSLTLSPSLSLTLFHSLSLTLSPSLSLTLFHSLSLTLSPSLSLTLFHSLSLTLSPSLSLTLFHSLSLTLSPSLSLTLSPSLSLTLSASLSLTLSPSLSLTLSASLSLTLSPSLSLTLSPSLSLTLSPSLSLTLSASLSLTLSASLSLTLSASLSLTLSPSLSLTLSPSLTLTLSASLSLTLSPSLTLTLSTSLSLTLSPCLSLTLFHSLSLTLSPSLSLTLSPSLSLTLSPSLTLTLSASLSLTLSASLSLTLSPSLSLSLSPPLLPPASVSLFPLIPRRHTLSRRRIIPLPQWKANPETDPEALFSKEQLVLALYPQTTCFYRALIHAPPHRPQDDYSVLFEDTSYTDGYSPPLNVAQRYVVACRENKKK